MGKSSYDKIIVYTAIFGGIDNLIEQPNYPNVDYICFTDNESLKSKGWTIIKINSKEKSPRLLAKKYKILPHRLKIFRKYKVSLWIDGNLLLKKTPWRLVQEYLKKYNIAFFEHPYRKNIYEEAKACVRLKKDKYFIIRQQLKKYYREGFKGENLIWGGIILRKHNNKEVIKSMEDWWKEINKGSIRDQLSFNYVAWKNNLKFCLIEKEKLHEFIKKFPHKNKKRENKITKFLKDKIKRVLPYEKREKIEKHLKKLKEAFIFLPKQPE